MEQYEHFPRVVQLIDEYELVINRGSDDGVKIGDRYLVFGLGDEIFDPVTEESLGVLELVRGRVEVFHVQSKMASVRSATKVQVTTGRKIYKKPIGVVNALAALSYATREEEIVEEPRTELSELNATIGDFAKPI